MERLVTQSRMASSAKAREREISEGEGRGRGRREHTDGVLEGARSRLDGYDLCAEHAHAEDVKALTPDVLGSHVDDAPAGSKKSVEVLDE